MMEIRVFVSVYMRQTVNNVRKDETKQVRLAVSEDQT